MVDYKKYLNEVIGKASRVIHGLTDYYHNEKDLHKLNQLRLIKGYFEEISKTHTERDNEIDKLRAENAKILDNSKAILLNFQDTIKHNEKLKLKIEEQQLFLKRLLFSNPNLLEKITSEEVKKMFGEKLYYEIKNNKYNPYRKSA